MRTVNMLNINCLAASREMASLLCLLCLLYARGRTAENSSLFSTVSLTPIVEYGHQQSRVEDNPKMPRRKPQNRTNGCPSSKREPQTKKPHPNKNRN